MHYAVRPPFSWEGKSRVHNVLGMLRAALEILLQSITFILELCVAGNKSSPTILLQALPLQKEFGSREESRGEAFSACQHRDPWDLGQEFLWSLNQYIQYIKVSWLALKCYCLVLLASLIIRRVRHWLCLRPEGNKSSPVKETASVHQHVSKTAPGWRLFQVHHWMFKLKEMFHVKALRRAPCPLLGPAICRTAWQGVELSYLQSKQEVVK